MERNISASTEEQLGHLLIRCGQRLGHRDGKHRTQGRILKILYVHGPMSQKELQDKLEIQPGSMSEIAAKLEHRGLIERQKNTDDKRMITLTLTDAGRSDVESHMARQHRHGPQDFSALTAQEQLQLQHLLEKLLHSWQAEEINKP